MEKIGEVMGYVYGFIVVVGGCVFAELFSIVVSWLICDWLERKEKKHHGN